MNMPNVRLLPDQIEKLIQAFTPFLADIPAKLYLYCSRTQLDKRGGDIDLLLLVETLAQRQALLAQKHVLIVSIETLIGEQKIDLSLATKASIETDPFLNLIWSDVILLYQWHK